MTRDETWLHTTGQLVQIAPEVVTRLRRGPKQVPGEHLWMIIGSWSVDPRKWTSNEVIQMDSENLISLSPPGCYWCEQLFEPRLFCRRVSG
jgi:hypothetical protein